MRAACRRDSRLAPSRRTRDRAARAIAHYSSSRLKVHSDTGTSGASGGWLVGADRQRRNWIEGTAGAAPLPRDTDSRAEDCLHVGGRPSRDRCSRDRADRLNWMAKRVAGWSLTSGSADCCSADLARPEDRRKVSFGSEAAAAFSGRPLGCGANLADSRRPT